MKLLIHVKLINFTQTYEGSVTSVDYIIMSIVLHSVNKANLSRRPAEF